MTEEINKARNTYLLNYLHSVKDAEANHLTPTGWQKLKVKCYLERCEINYNTQTLLLMIQKQAWALFGDAITEEAQTSS